MYSLLLTGSADDNFSPRGFLTLNISQSILMYGGTQQRKMICITNTMYLCSNQQNYTKHHPISCLFSIVARFTVFTWEYLRVSKIDVPNNLFDTCSKNSSDRLLFQKIQNRCHPNRTRQVSNKRFQNPICIFAVIVRFLHFSRCLHSERSTAPYRLSVFTRIGGFVRRVYISFPPEMTFFSGFRSILRQPNLNKQHMFYSALYVFFLLPPCDFLKFYFSWNFIKRQ